MIDMDDSAGYLERAEMHEQLAAATSDGPARKMHMAMAAEYRRKAEMMGMTKAMPLMKNDASMLMG